MTKGFKNGAYIFHPPDGDRWHPQSPEVPLPAAIEISPILSHVSGCSHSDSCRFLFFHSSLSCSLSLLAVLGCGASCHCVPALPLILSLSYRLLYAAWGVLKHMPVCGVMAADLSTIQQVLLIVTCESAWRCEAVPCCLSYRTCWVVMAMIHKENGIKKQGE
jgi:hypothetical protein